MLNSTRRAFLGAAAAVSLPVAAPANPVTAGPAVGADPLLEAIRAYQAGMRDFNANSPKSSDAADAYVAVSYGPPLDRLTGWDKPATSREAAIAALALALDVDLGVYGCDAADSMIRAALGYLEG